MRILDKIHSHADLVGLSPQEQTVLCQEIRDFLVDNVSKTGGHLAANLGVVELFVAIETVYDTQTDRLIFDVGHQSYVHKLLTGRQADFAHLRQFGGMAGFPKPSESQSDAFVAGHASSSVSIALGMARARSLQKEKYQVIAVMGDGAATGGMAYEALNDAAVSGEPMVIILNDNEMSIAPNVGGFAQHLSRLRTKESYLGMKRRYRQAMSKTMVGRGIYRTTRRMKEWLKKVLLRPSIFENMGLTYLGPVDGHDVQGLIGLLRLAKTMNRPVVIHVHTQKGKGYAPAEQAPDRFHGIGKFDPATGEALAPAKPSFSQMFGQTMCDLAQKEPKLCAITAAMPEGTGLLEFLQKYPERTFDVGIAEEHAVSMAGGLAKQGMVPVVALYSTFLQRSFDQIMQDISMLNLHVVLAVDRAGLVGEDGETHHGIYDTGFLRLAPGMLQLCPASRKELQEMLQWSVLEQSGPVAIRYPRGGDGAYEASAWNPDNYIALHKPGKDCAIVTYGTMVNQAVEAANRLQEKGIDAAVLRLTALCDAAYAQLQVAAEEIPCIFVLEEVAAAASIHDTVARFLPGHRVEYRDLGNAYVPHGDMKTLYQHYGLDAASVAEYLQEAIQLEK